MAMVWLCNMDGWMGLLFVGACVSAHKCVPVVLLEICDCVTV